MPPIQSSQIFISYARRDGRDLATKLREGLEQQGFDIWQDVVAMGGGDEWWPQIAHAIEHARSIILILTDGALESPVVRREWVHARRVGTPILPVVFDPAVLNRAPQWVKKVDVFILQPSHPDYEATQRRFIAQLHEPVPATPTINMTPPQSDTTVVRPSLQRRLTERLLHLDTSEPRYDVVVLWGPGGFGKTTVAKIFAGDAAVTEAYTGGILWLTLGEKGERLTDSIYAVLDALKRPRPEPTNALRALHDALEGRDTLLILDDVWEISLIEPLLSLSQGSILITTRDASVAKRDDSPLQIEQMTGDESAQTLLKHLPDTLNPTLKEQRRLAILAERLGGWPLLLGIFGGALREEIVTGKHSLTDALDYVESGIEEAGLDAFDDTDAGRGKALNLSIDISLRPFSEIEQTRIYELGVLPEDVSAPESLIQMLWQSTAHLSGFASKRLLGRLRGHFVLPDPNGGVRLHDRMREIFRHRLGNLVLQTTHRALLKGWGVFNPLPDDYAWHYVGYHLEEAGQSEILRGLLLDYGWVSAKLAATDVPSLLSDYDRLEGDNVVLLIRSALIISAAVLTQDKTALAHQLMGRLIPHRSIAEIRGFTDGITVPTGGIMPAYPDNGFPTHDPAGGWVRQILHGHSHSVRCVAFSPDGTLIASGSTDNLVIIWDAATGTLRHVLNNHTQTVNSVFFSPDGQTVASASDDRSIRLWDVQTGTLLRTLLGHNGLITRAVYSPDGNLLFSGGSDRTIRRWELATDKSRSIFRHKLSIRSIGIHPEGKTILVTSKSPDILEIDAETGSVIRELCGHSGAVNCVVYSHDGRLIASGSVDRTVRVWDAQTGELLQTLYGSHRGVTSVMFSPDNTLLLGSNEEKSACLWDVQTAELVRRLEGHSSRIYEAAFSPNGQMIVTASNDRMLRLWNADIGKTAPKTKVHNNGVTGVNYLNSGHIRSTASDDPSAYLWDAATGIPVEALPTEEAKRDISPLSPDERYQLRIQRDNVDVLTNTSEQTVIRQLKIPTESTTGDVYHERLTAAHFLTDNRHILTAGLDGMAYIWDNQTGDIIHHLSNIGAISCAHCAPDNKTVVLALRDHTIWLWDTLSGQAKRVFYTDAPIWKMAWIPSSNIFAAGDGAGRILFLRLT